MQLQDQELSSISNSLQSTILKFVKEGVLIVSDRLSSLYMNTKAKEICQKILHNSTNGYNLPLIISEIANRFTQQPLLGREMIVQDCCLPGNYLLRIRAINVAVDSSFTSGFTENPWLLFLIEDKNDNLQEELKIAQEKYRLTEREAEVYGLLSQSMTYHNIAKILHVSLNTVRTHVKNINEKKRNYYPT